MSEQTITLAKGGKRERTVQLSKIQVPDLWHIARAELDLDCHRKILETWHLAHDLLDALREMRRPEVPKPETLSLTPATPKNPFRKETWNLTAQMKLQKTDPQLAARLKAAAKEDA